MIIDIVIVHCYPYKNMCIFTHTKEKTTLYAHIVAYCCSVSELLMICIIRYAYIYNNNNNKEIMHLYVKHTDQCCLLLVLRFIVINTY